MSKIIPEYIPTLWENGDIITKDKLSNLEQGVMINNRVLTSVIINSENAFAGIQTGLSEINDSFLRNNQVLLPVQIKTATKSYTVLAYDVMDVQNAIARLEDSDYISFNDLRADLVSKLGFAISFAFLTDDNPPSLSNRFAAIFRMNNFGCLEQVSEEELSGKLMEDFDSTELIELYVVKLVTSSYYEDNIPFKITQSIYESPFDAMYDWKIYVSKTNVTINGTSYNWALLPLALSGNEEHQYSGYVYLTGVGEFGDFFEAVSLAPPDL